MSTELEQIKGLLVTHMELSEIRYMQTKEQITRLSTSVLGDEGGGIKGLAKRTEHVEDYIKKDELLKSNLKGKVWGIVLIGTPIITFVTSVLFWLITHS